MRQTGHPFNLKHSTAVHRLKSRMLQGLARALGYWPKQTSELTLAHCGLDHIIHLLSFPTCTIIFIIVVVHRSCCSGGLWGLWTHSIWEEQTSTTRPEFMSVKIKKKYWKIQWKPPQASEHGYLKTHGLWKHHFLALATNNIRWVVL